jgi:hypothetical protein
MTHKSRISKIIESINGHRRLIESQANHSQIKVFQESRRLEDSELETKIESQSLHRLQAVNSWLKATNVEDDQYHFSKVRSDYPGTGRWLVDNTSFQDWFHPQYPKIPPLLWLNGMPGAGNYFSLLVLLPEM